MVCIQRLEWVLLDSASTVGVPVCTVLSPTSLLYTTPAWPSLVCTVLICPFIACIAPNCPSLVCTVLICQSLACSTLRRPLVLFMVLSCTHIVDILISSYFMCTVSDTFTTTRWNGTFMPRLVPIVQFVTVTARVHLYRVRYSLCTIYGHFAANVLNVCPYRATLLLISREYFILKCSFLYVPIP